MAIQTDPPETINWDKIATVTLFVGLLIYILLRAYLFQLTYDEVASIVGHVPFSVGTIISSANHIACANNHTINTLWLKFCLLAFGNNELLLRLPNILSFVSAYYFIFRLAQLLHQKNTTVPYFFYLLVFFANPYLIEFFALARGYGIMSGAVCASVYYTTLYIYSEKIGALRLACAAGTLACFGNLIAIFYLAALFSLFFIVIIQNYYENNKKSTPLLLLTNLFSASGIAFLLLLVPLHNLIASGDGAGGEKGFFVDTIYSLSNSFLYNNPFLVGKIVAGHSAQWYLSIFFIIIFISIVLVLAYKSKKIGTKIVNSPFFASVFLLTTVSSISIFLFHTRHVYYLQNRTGIILMLLFSWAVAAAIHALPTDWKYKKTVLWLLILPFLLHFTLVANVSRSQEWGCDGDVKAIISTLNERYKTQNRTTSFHIFSAADGGISLRYYMENQTNKTLIWQEHRPDFMYIDTDKVRAAQDSFDLLLQLPRGTLMQRKNH